MNYLIILLLLLLILYIKYDNKAAINLSRIKYLTKHISIYRPISSNNLSKTKKFIINYIMTEIPSLLIKEQKFTKKINNIDYQLSNIIAYNPNINININRRPIILTAHIDSLAEPEIDAAIDSGTSIGLIIEIVRNLMIIDNNYPISIVFFDGEEPVGDKMTEDNSLLGSTYFVDKSSQLIDKNALVFIIDLIGGSINSNPIKSFALNDKATDIFYSLYKINKKLYANQIFIDIVSNKKIRDDHIPFMKKNIDYIHLIPDKFPDQHHKLIDNYENVNWKYVDIFTNVIFNYLIINN